MDTFCEYISGIFMIVRMTFGESSREPIGETRVEKQKRKTNIEKQSVYIPFHQFSFGIFKLHEKLTKLY